MRFGNLHRVHVDALLEPSLGLADLDVVTTHLSLAHLAIFGKSPVFETITSHPLACLGVLEFVPELHGNLVVAKGEQFFAETVFLFGRPFTSQELDNGFSAAEEVISVAPDAIRGICLQEVIRSGPSKKACAGEFQVVRELEDKNRSKLGF
jgi:hypothetical protein